LAASTGWATSTVTIASGMSPLLDDVWQVPNVLNLEDSVELPVKNRIYKIFRAKQAVE
jgi:hypothetical protein